MKPVLLCHLGLGDAIILAGAAVVLAERHDGLLFPCWIHNQASIRSFFVDHPEIEVVPIESEALLQNAARPNRTRPILTCGHYSDIKPENGESYDRWMHRTLEVEMAVSWDRCPLSEAAKKLENHSAFIPPVDVVHEDYQRGYLLHKRRGRVPEHCVTPCGTSILAWANRLCIAPQIHVIDSCMLHLADRIPTHGQLFFHRYARPDTQTIFDLPLLRKPWNLLE